MLTLLHAPDRNYHEVDRICSRSWARRYEIICGEKDLSGGADPTRETCPMDHSGHELIFPEKEVDLDVGMIYLILTEER